MTILEEDKMAHFYELFWGIYMDPANRDEVHLRAWLRSLGSDLWQYFLNKVDCGALDHLTSMGRAGFAVSRSVPVSEHSRGLGHGIRRFSTSEALVESFQTLELKARLFEEERLRRSGIR